MPRSIGTVAYPADRWRATIQRAPQYEVAGDGGTQQDFLFVETARLTLPVVVWLILSTIWGSTWLFIKIGLDAGLPPITFAGIRFVIASVPLILWMIARRVRLPRHPRDWWLMIGTGLVVFSLNYGLVFWGEAHISSGLTAILYTTLPLHGMVFAHFMLPAEPMTARKVGGAVLGLAGVALIFSNQIELRGAPAVWGSLAVVVGALVTAYGSVIVKKYGGHIEPITMSTVQMTVGFVPMLAIGIPLEGNPLHYSWTAAGVVALFYLALLGSSVTFVLLYWLYQRMEVTRTMLIPLMSTLLAVVLGMIVLGEALTVRVVLGGAGILLGLAVATGRQPPRGHTGVQA